MAASLRLLTMLFALSPITAAVAVAPLAPAAGTSVLEQAAIVTAELQTTLEKDDSPHVVALRSFLDPTSGIRVYHRDGQLLFAISTTRNMTAAEKWSGERTVAALARQVLQKDFAALDVDGGFQHLDAKAVRAILIEPESLSASFGEWRNGSVGTSGAVRGVVGGGCGGRFFGDGTTPIPFAPAGYWAGGSTTPAPCVGCR